MEPKSTNAEAHTHVPSHFGDKLRKKIEDLYEDLNQGFDVIDDEALQALYSHVSQVQEATRREQELRQRLSQETLETQKQNKPLPDRVKLNVGGKVFTTSLSILTSVKGSFFDSMFGCK